MHKSPNIKTLGKQIHKLLLIQSINERIHYG